MVRAPCCEKMGLKKGPWSRDEDEILINYVTLHGHENWRSLPKQAGLLRCGKSCRLRWINYLRPDIKRGNFSEEEEETIISLHQLLGNRWSAIAARLPGRTDNEIKNVWHTHFKKRIKKIQQSTTAPTSNQIQISELKKEENSGPEQSTSQFETEPSSPQQHSSVTTTTTTSVEDNSVSMNADELTDYLQVDDSFWSEVFSSSENSATSEFNDDDFRLHFPEFDGYGDHDNSNIIDMNTSDSFWYNILTNSSSQELPEL